VGAQRQNWSDGTLKPARKAKLEEIGFQFSPLISKTEGYNWELNYQELKKTHKTNQEIQTKNKKRAKEDAHKPVVPAAHILLWIITQRSEYKEGRLSENRIKKLKSIDFDFSSDDDADGEEAKELALQVWDQKCEELEEFQSEHGHCKPPSAMKASKRWAICQRKRRRNSELTSGQIDRLDKIGFVWDLQNLDEGWELACSPC
jgi:hypothetical protein